MQLVHTTHPQPPSLGGGGPHGPLTSGGAPMLTGVTGGGPNAIVMSGELNLAQAGPPPNGNVVLPPQQPFARSKNKGNNKLLNGFSDDRRDIVMLSREECDRITKKAIKCIRRPGKGKLHVGSF